MTPCFLFYAHSIPNRLILRPFRAKRDVSLPLPRMVAFSLCVNDPLFNLFPRKSLREFHQLGFVKL
jgi:hypothetical protein